MPVALLIGFSSTFFWERRDAVARAGAVAVDAPLTQAASLALEWHPAVMVITEDVYAFDPSRFDALAEIVGATIAVLRDEEETDFEVTRRVLRALFDSSRRWSSEVERPTTPAPAKRISGIRERRDDSREATPRRRYG